MRTIVILLALALLLTLWLAPAAAAPAAARVTGGGTGSFNADLDGDNDVDGSQFGLAVRFFQGGAATGRFKCLMAGRSDFLGLRLMAVEGQIGHGWLNADGSASFGSTQGSVNLGGGQIIRGVPFEVTVTAGGPGVGTLRLTVLGAFDGVPGDTIPGNGNYDLPIETVRSGQITIH